jgi:hypothetical protein
MNSMANNMEKLRQVLETLDYLEAPGFISDTSADKQSYRYFLYTYIQKRIDVDAIYFIDDVPMIYFKYFSDVSEQQISSVHSKIWNQGIAPIFFAVLPDEIRVYSTYLAPVLKKDTGSAEVALIKSIKNPVDYKFIQKELRDFSRLEVDAGYVWRAYAKEFSNDERINQVLLHNLKELRITLEAAGLNYEYIHSLIGRTILMLYLEERGILNSDYYQAIDKDYRTYVDLLNSKTKLYKAYTELTEYFGTDLFPISAEEKKAVSTKHLNILKSILSSVDNNWYFWAFSFKFIPVELICSIYEEFLYIEEKGKEIASYAPPALARIMLNQILTCPARDINIKVLDPACGSSIFLVEAYKRIIESWMMQNPDKDPDFATLHKFIQNSIFGFDYKLEALRFTVFSLYLKMLDYIDNIDLNVSPQLPSIIGKNLIESDFFGLKSPLHKNKYDLIIGNPPWQSNYGEKAKDYLKATKYPVGDKQISQVFLWHAADLVSENGVICMLMPSKGLLYNFNPKNIEFREKFFKSFDIKKIINLSLFSNLLFENSKFPASIIVYGLDTDTSKKKSTIYYAPKPSNKSWEFSTLVVDPSDVKKLPRQQILKNQYIWKIAFVGTGRDFMLVNHLDKNFAKIDYFCEDMEWKYGEGFQLGGGDRNVNKDMAAMVYIPAKSIYPFYVDRSELEKLGKDTFHRPRDFSLYKAPHTLVRGGQIYAAYIDYDAVFTHAVMSFASEKAEDADALKLLAAYLNSSMVLYYLFLTSSTWCIERTDIHLAEYRTLPFCLPSNKPLMQQILDDYERLSEFVGKNLNNYQSQDKYHELKLKLDNSIFDIFGLDEEQRQIIIDANTYSINYFQDYSKSVKSKSIPDAILKPTSESLKNYADKFCKIINRHIAAHKYKITAKVYAGDAPLDVMSFTLMPDQKNVTDISVIKSSDEQRKLLKKLDQIVLKQTSESLYITKNLRVFEGETFHLVKPAEKRFWTDTMAFNDADKNVREILKGFKS